MVTRAWRAAPLLAVVLAVALLGTVVTGGWFVHPLGGLALAWLASSIFSERGRRNVPTLGAALGLLFVLVALGAGWLVHPAAGLALALLASVLFRRRRRDVPVILVTLAVMAVLAVLGAAWLVYPLGGLLLGWLATVMFSGQLFTESRAERETRSAREQAAEPAALPPGEAPFSVGGVLRREPVGREAVPAPGRKRKQAAPAASPQPVSEEAESTAVAGLLREYAGQLPPEAALGLRALDERGRETLAYLHARGKGEGEHALLVRHVLNEYAPDAVRAYLRLPPSTANVTPLQDGKTGRDLLIEQLDLLQSAVKQALESATRDGGQEILTHQRFLETKFGRGGAKKDFEV